MSDRPNTPASKTQSHSSRPRPLSDEPGFVDGIPVEDLVRLTREFTARITNEDRQRLTQEISESGRTIHSGAPFLLQQFFTGKINLDSELTRRFPNAPLLSSASFAPAPGKRARRGWAQIKAQDEAAAVIVDIHGLDGTLDLGFVTGGMVSVNFALGSIPDVQRARFLELLRRPNGIAILWTRERWEKDYLVFVVRERFARMYAFGPGRFDAACRLTPDVLDEFSEWLRGFWGSEVAARTDETWGSMPTG